MFWVHEILAKNKDGVATAWILATKGRATRKEISRVNVSKACLTIAEPGAPLALRLQGNLLYGVAQIHAHQATYILADVKRLQTEMRSFELSHVLDTENTAVLKADKAKSKKSVIPDDAGFRLDIEDLRPMPLVAGLDTDQLLADMERHQTDQEATLLPRHLRGTLPLKSDEDEVPVIDRSWLGFYIDGEGNLIESDERPRTESAAIGSYIGSYGDKPAQKSVSCELDMLDGEFILPRLSPAPVRQAQDEQAQPKSASSVYDVTNVASEQAAAPARRKRARKFIVPDESTQVNMETFRDWQINYLDLRDDERRKTSRAFREAQSLRASRNSGYRVTFGRGLGDVGRDGPGYPLTDMFSGKTLALFLNIGTSGDALPETGRRGQPAREEVQPSMGGAQGTAVHDDAVEVGRQQRPGHSSFLSDTPWNRPSLLAPPSSSIGGSAHMQSQTGRDRVIASPLQARHSNFPQIQRLSDQPALISEDGFGFMLQDTPAGSSLRHEIGFSSNDKAVMSLEVAADVRNTSENYFARQVKNIARKKGKTRDEGSSYSQKWEWTTFDDIVPAESSTKQMAVDTFFSVLSLATQNKIKVEQDSSGFNIIRVGVTASGDEEVTTSSHCKAPISGDDEDIAMSDIEEGDTRAVALDDDVLMEDV